MKNKIMRVTVILPTYNERENIEKVISKVQEQKERVKDVDLNILVVDDNSPDNTSGVVKRLQKKFSNLYLITGKKKGLGAAYIRGFKYALKKLKADIVCQMDSDLSHNPKVLPKLIRQVSNGKDVVIGSRYVSGGKIPKNWGLLRVLNSKMGNLVAKYILGLKNIKDCTGGFRAFKSKILKKINVETIESTGYVFQVSLLYRALQNGAVILEVPIHFRDREKGKSKLSVTDVLEFFKEVIRLRWVDIKPDLKTFLYIFFFVFMYVVGFRYMLLSSISGGYNVFLSTFIYTVSFILILQGVFSVFIMLYAWENSKEVNSNKSPKQFSKAKNSFTAIVPALREENVIDKTIEAIANIDYPEHLKQIIIVNRSDDKETIETSKKAIKKLKKENISLLIPPSKPKNKPDKLNYAFNYVENDVVVIFDAEDEPHSDIYNVVNTIMQTKGADVVQSGVQLMNYDSNWFSALNVLEYFFWFKSSLHFFAKNGVVPLGGNTVFFKRQWLKKVGGWDEDCLTEDAEIGLKLSVAGAKFEIVYDEKHTTREETPPTIKGFIKQRTRWNQGFIQVLFKKEWLNLPKLSQRLLAIYILVSPILQALLFIYLPFAVYFALNQTLPTVLSLFSFIPLFIFILQLTTNAVGLIEFTKLYKIKLRLFILIRMVILFHVYQFLLMLAAFRALFRFAKSQDGWEKTAHVNAHRDMSFVKIEN